MNKNPLRWRVAAEAVSCAFIYGIGILVSVFPALTVGFYNDNTAFFSLFRNNAYSLNRFGEPAWWLPHTNFGHAGYMSSALGPLAQLSPASVAMSSVMWMLGKVGMEVGDFRAVYGIYSFILLPTIFIASAWLVGRQFSNLYVRVATVAIAAFSPVIIQNIFDPGLVEPAAYSLLCVYSVSRYIQRRDAQSFFVLLLAFSLLIHTLNLAFLFWAVPFVVALLWAIFGPRSSRRIAVEAILARPAWHWAVAMLVLGVAALPFAEIGFSFRDFTKPGYGGGGYNILSLIPGNPFQILLASTPGVNFLVNIYRPSIDVPLVQYLPHPLEPAGTVGYAYMGFMAIPLAIAGLVYGRRAMRWRLGVIGMVLFSVVLLAGFSPFYALVVQIVTPLRLNNHFSDLMFQGGGFLVLMFLALFGLERIADGHRGAARVCLWAQIIWGAASTAFLFALYRNSLFQFGTLIGFYILVQLVAAFAMWQLAHRSGRRALGRLSALLVCLIVADMATTSFWELRAVMSPKFTISKTELDSAVSDGLDLASRHTTFAARIVLVRKEYDMIIRDRSASLEALPMLAVLAHGFRLPTAFTEAGLDKSRWTQSGTARMISRSFNTTVVDVNSSSGGELFVRDTWDPNWRASVNDQPVTIRRAVGIFKLIPVPAGRSQVVLRFAPVRLQRALWISYLALMILAILVISSRRTAARSMAEGSSTA